MTRIIFFLCENWLNVSLVLIGLLALIAYMLQEHRKKIEAAFLLILQIDELQDRLRQLSAYLVDGKINSTAFCESLPLLEINYWNQFKHYFVREMDEKSFSTFNLFFDYVREIQEQQDLLKALQKNSFYQTQNLLSSTEAQLIANGINHFYWNAPQQTLTGSSFSVDQFWNTYKPQQAQLRSIMSQNALTEYSPVQIGISIEKKLRAYNMLEISSSSGYQLLKKMIKKHP